MNEPDIAAQVNATEQTPTDTLRDALAEAEVGEIRGVLILFERPDGSLGVCSSHGLSLASEYGMARLAAKEAERQYLRQVEGGT